MIEAQTIRPAPDPTPRRGLRREEAARYIGVSTGLFDAMVKDGRMPKPKRLRMDPASVTRGCVVWDIRKLDLAFDALMFDAEEDVDNPFDDETE